MTDHATIWGHTPPIVDIAITKLLLVAGIHKTSHILR